MCVGHFGDIHGPLAYSESRDDARLVREAFCLHLAWYYHYYSEQVEHCEDALKAFEEFVSIADSNLSSIVEGDQVETKRAFFTIAQDCTNRRMKQRIGMDEVHLYSTCCNAPVCVLAYICIILFLDFGVN